MYSSPKSRNILQNSQTVAQKWEDLLKDESYQKQLL